MIGKGGVCVLLLFYLAHGVCCGRWCSSFVLSPALSVTLLPRVVDEKSYEEVGVNLTTYNLLAKWWGDVIAAPIEASQFYQEASESIKQSKQGASMSSTSLDSLCDSNNSDGTCAWCRVALREELTEAALMHFIYQQEKEKDHRSHADLFKLLKQVLKLRQETFESLRQFFYFQHLGISKRAAAGYGDMCVDVYMYVYHVRTHL